MPARLRPAGFYLDIFLITCLVLVTTAAAFVGVSKLFTPTLRIEEDMADRKKTCWWCMDDSNPPVEEWNCVDTEQDTANNESEKDFHERHRADVTADKVLCPPITPP